MLVGRDSRYGERGGIGSEVSRRSKTAHDTRKSLARNAVTELDGKRLFSWDVCGRYAPARPGRYEQMRSKKSASHHDLGVTVRLVRRRGCCHETEDHGSMMNSSTADWRGGEPSRHGASILKHLNGAPLAYAVHEKLKVYLSPLNSLSRAPQCGLRSSSPY